MVKALFDTNILIDFLNGVPQAKFELSRYRDKAISMITWMEVMAGATPATQSTLHGFLQEFSHVAIDEQVGTVAVTLRQRYRIKLPDAIVWASAQVSGRLLVTRDTGDFNVGEPGIRIPYQL